MSPLPVGVFDSGIGGLSVLNALRAELPHEHFVYFADTAYAPYGERGADYVAERTRTIARHLLGEHEIKAMVVACNTATAAAIHALRLEYPQLPVVGIEPALRPAVTASRTRRIAVIATRGTIESAKFQTLHASLAGQADFVLIPCDGLAGAIERSEHERVAELSGRYLGMAGRFGMQSGDIDTLVLGCTHYPFIAAELRRHTGDAVRFIEPGAAVAQQTRRLLDKGGLLRSIGDGAVTLIGSGQASGALAEAGERWLVPAALPWAG